MIKLTNLSPFTVRSILVTDKLPPGFQYVGATSDKATLIQEPTHFKITEPSLVKLASDALPFDVKNKLVSLRNQRFPRKEEFVEALIRTLGQAAATQYSAQILRHTKGGDIDGNLSWALQKLKPGESAMFWPELEAAYLGRFENTVQATTPNTTKTYVASCSVEVIEPKLKAVE